MVLRRGFAPPRLAEYCKGLKTSSCPPGIYFQCIFAVGFFGTTPLLFLFCWLHEWLLRCCRCCPVPGGFSVLLVVPSVVPGKALAQHWRCGSLLCNVNTHKAKAYKEGISGSKVSFTIKEWGGKLLCLIVLFRFGCSCSRWLLPLLFSISFVFVCGHKGRALCIPKPVTGILLMGLVADSWLGYN